MLVDATDADVVAAVPPLVVPGPELVAVDVAPTLLVVVAGPEVAPVPGEGDGAAPAAFPETAGLGSITL